MEIASLVLDATSIGLTVGSQAAKAIPPALRKCFITISNESLNYSLCNPRTHIKSGKCCDPLPPSIGPAKSGEASFKNNPIKSNGAVGVITYDLLDTSTRTSSQKLAVFFKVPFNQTQSPCAYALGVVDAATECDLELCTEMSKGTTEKFVRGKAKGECLTLEGKALTVRGTMSKGRGAVMKVELCEN